MSCWKSCLTNENQTETETDAYFIPFYGVGTILGAGIYVLIGEVFDTICRKNLIIII